MPPKKKTGTKKKKKVVAKKPVIVIPPDSKLPQLADAKNSALMHTIAIADINSMNRLVAHYNYEETLKTTDINGSTPMHMAVKKNDTRMVDALLSFNKIDLNVLELPIVGGYSAVHHACLLGHHEVLIQLLKAGADPNLKCNSTNGETALQLCCKLGRLQCAHALIDAGASPDVKDNFGNNASFWAHKYRQDALIRELHLPPVKTATADEFVALLLKKNPNFVLPSIKVKVKKGKGKDGKKKGKK